MPAFNLKLADEVIAVTCLYESTKSFCQDYLTDEEPSFQVAVTEQDIADEQIKSDAQRQREGLEALAYPAAYLETLALYRKVVDVLLEKGIILFHGSVIAVDEEAYLFTAPSGTGKSTHVRLWREYFGQQAVMVNDDKPLIRLDGEKAVVYGTPWMGKHGLGQPVAYPLKAICHLQRGQTNRIEKVNFSSLYHVLFQQIQRPREASQMSKLLTCIDSLGQKVDFYQLFCTISIEAVQLAYKEMKGI